MGCAAGLARCGLRRPRIDGIANGIGRLAAIGGSGARRFQTGIAVTMRHNRRRLARDHRRAYGGYASGVFTPMTLDHILTLLLIVPAVG